VSRDFCIWRQWLKISCLAFKVADSGLKIMFHFSLVQSLQIPVMGE
jgi:hypothetical protein